MELSCLVARELPERIGQACVLVAHSVAMDRAFLTGGVDNASAPIETYVSEWHFSCCLLSNCLEWFHSRKRWTTNND